MSIKKEREILTSFSLMTLKCHYEHKLITKNYVK